jgi:hypothetical protein
MGSQNCAFSDMVGRMWPGAPRSQGMTRSEGHRDRISTPAMCGIHKLQQCHLTPQGAPGSRPAYTMWKNEEDCVPIMDTSSHCCRVYGHFPTAGHSLR